MVMGLWMLAALAISVAEGPLLLLIAAKINHDGHVINLMLLVLLMALELSCSTLGGLHQVVLILI